MRVYRDGHPPNLMLQHNTNSQLLWLWWAIPNEMPRFSLGMHLTLIRLRLLSAHSGGTILGTSHRLTTELSDETYYWGSDITERRYYWFRDRLTWLNVFILKNGKTSLNKIKKESIPTLWVRSTSKIWSFLYSCTMFPSSLIMMCVLYLLSGLFSTCSWKPPRDSQIWFSKANYLYFLMVGPLSGSAISIPSV